MIDRGRIGFHLRRDDATLSAQFDDDPDDEPDDEPDGEPEEEPEDLAGAAAGAGVAVEPLEPLESPPLDELAVPDPALSLLDDDVADEAPDDELEPPRLSVL